MLCGPEADCVLLAQAVGFEVGLLRGAIFWTMFKEMPDGGFHRETGRFRRDVKFEIVHREGDSGMATSLTSSFALTVPGGKGTPATANFFSGASSCRGRSTV